MISRIFRENKFSRISRFLSKFAKFAKICSREKKFSRKLVPAKISAFKLVVFTMFCVKDVSLKRPRSKLSSPAIYSALEAHLVPPILNDCHVVAFRGIFSASQEDIILQIAARRRQIELKLQENSEVRYHLLKVYPSSYFALVLDYTKITSEVR